MQYYPENTLTRKKIEREKKSQRGIRTHNPEMNDQESCALPTALKMVPVIEHYDNYSYQ